MEVSLFNWLAPAARDLKEKRRPLVVGFSGVQGIGKTTLTSHLSTRFNQAGLRAVRISIDDFYLTHAEQLRVAAENPTNPFLQARGYPGTHDLDLGCDVLSALTRERKPGAPCSVKIPRYDKGAHLGKGDRAPEPEWDELALPVDVVILEGWMLGYSPVSDTELASLKDVDLTHFREINTRLKDYSRWMAFVEYFVLLKPLDLLNIVEWRIEAEEKMKAAGLGGMASDQIKRYVESFLPAHQTYLPRLSESLPCEGKNRLFVIKKDRAPK